MRYWLLFVGAWLLTSCASLIPHPNVELKYQVNQDPNHLPLDMSDSTVARLVKFAQSPERDAMLLKVKEEVGEPAYLQTKQAFDLVAAHPFSLSEEENATLRRIEADQNLRSQKSLRNGRFKYLAVILAIFGGVFGLHRFYLNRNNTALWQLALGLGFVLGFGVFAALASVGSATAFAFGVLLALLWVPVAGIVSVWVVVDLIRILIGSLKPYGGEYYDADSRLID